MQLNLWYCISYSVVFLAAWQLISKNIVKLGPALFCWVLNKCKTLECSLKHLTGVDSRDNHIFQGIAKMIFMVSASMLLEVLYYFIYMFTITFVVDIKHQYVNFSLEKNIVQLNTSASYTDF